MNPLSIRFPLLGWYAGFLVVLFIVLGVSSVLGLKYYLKHLTKGSLVRRARVIGGTLQSDLALHGEIYVIEDITSHFAPEINARFVRVTRDDNSIFYVSGLPKDGSFNPAMFAPLRMP